MLIKILEDSKQIPQTFKYALCNNTVTIKNQEEALTNPYWAFLFARKNIPESDIKALQAKACEIPCYAYLFARYIPGADIKYCH